MHMIVTPEPSELAIELTRILTAREPFVAYKGKLTGCPAPRHIDGWDSDLFDLAEGMVEALVGAHPQFVVWSYGVPIAWLASDQEFVEVPPDRDITRVRPEDESPVWVVNPQHLSSTSDRHRRIVCKALGGRDNFVFAEGWV